MKLEISNRLKKIIEMVGVTNTVADIASDHGYVPIILLNEDKIKYAIATDINIKPIENLKKNIELYLSAEKKNCIDVRLGNGLQVIDKNEADIIVISGIGFDLMTEILSNIDEYSFEYLILSSQSKYYQFRKFLHSKKLKIVDEAFVVEDNKEYFIQKVIKTEEIQNFNDETFYMYSEILIKNKNEQLYTYINKRIKRLEHIIAKIDRQNEKYDILNNELKLSYKAIEYYGV